MFILLTIKSIKFIKFFLFLYALYVLYGSFLIINYSLLVIHFLTIKSIKFIKLFLFLYVLYVLYGSFLILNYSLLVVHFLTIQSIEFIKLFFLYFIWLKLFVIHYSLFSGVGGAGVSFSSSVLVYRVTASLYCIARLLISCCTWALSSVGVSNPWASIWAFRAR